MTDRYVVHLDGKAVVMFDTLKEAGDCVTDDPDGAKFIVWDTYTNRFVTPSELLLASILPKPRSKKTDWKKAGF
jgi:hypothetical protein